MTVAQIPVKISTLLSSENIKEIPDLVDYCRELGVRRMVLRKLYGGKSPPPPTAGWSFARDFAGNAVYDAGGIEVTVWDFERTRLQCLNLFPDGSITDSYLLKPELKGRSLDIESWVKELDRSIGQGILRV
jgi:hypothetical protein